MGHGPRKSRSSTAAKRVVIPFGPWELTGALSLPPAAQGVVLFASDAEDDETTHALRALASAVQHEGFATLMLGPPSSAGDPEPRAACARQHYQIHRDVQRLLAATDWLASTDIANLPIGLLGIGKVGAPALHAAAARRGRIQAVVIVGGEADFAAGDLLHLVDAPTLCITNEEQRLRPSMLDHLQCEHRHECVPGPYPLRDKQAISHTCALAGQWFRKHLLALVESQTGPVGRGAYALTPTHPTCR
jgi:putative phosphoribosyl transferase